MLNRMDRHIMGRLLVFTLFLLIMLIFIFVIIDFSEKSDDFADRGASFKEIINNYYLQYIPEIIRLVLPVAIFTACLLLVGQMADRVEIIALKAAGISLYRFALPFLLFAFFAALGLSWFDAFIIPKANEKRINFERQYVNKRSDRVDKNEIFRQESERSLVQIGYFDTYQKTAYRIIFFNIEDDKLVQTTDAMRMAWIDSSQVWRMYNVKEFLYKEDRIVLSGAAQKDTVINLYPRDFARTTADIDQLSYPEIIDYIASLERSGAGSIELPKVQFYGKLSYPFSIIGVSIIGVALASVRRKGGKGVYLAIGLFISFVYLVVMKIAEPFGVSGSIEPWIAASFPHLFFLAVGIGLLLFTRK